MLKGECNCGTVAFEISAEVSGVFVCHCSICRRFEGTDGDPLNIGRKTRIISPALSRALKSRDGGCRYPGCDRKRHTQGHHLHHWANGRETKLDNLISLCWFHHRLVHEGGYGVRRTDDGAVIFTRADGSRVQSNGAQCFRGNVERPDLLQRHLHTSDPELSITANTARCQWRGETMDYSQAIEAMQVLERKAVPLETLGTGG